VLREIDFLLKKLMVDWTSLHVWRLVTWEESKRRCRSI